MKLIPTAIPDVLVVEPTVFTDVQPGHRIAQEEIFGPVLSVIEVGSWNVASYANFCVLPSA